MAEYKFTSEELKKCIECCIKAETWGDCQKLRCPASSKHGCRFYLRTDDDYENTIYMEILKDVLDLINNMQSGWTSVDERLPDKGQGVLAYRGDFNGDMMNTYTYLGSGNWEDDYGYRGSAEHEGITHWMPLPEPPQMKGGAE